MEPFCRLSVAVKCVVLKVTSTVVKVGHSSNWMSLTGVVVTVPSLTFERSKQCGCLGSPFRGRKFPGSTRMRLLGTMVTMALRWTGTGPTRASGQERSQHHCGGRARRPYSHPWWRRLKSLVSTFSPTVDVAAMPATSSSKI